MKLTSNRLFKIHLKILMKLSLKKSKIKNYSKSKLLRKIFVFVLATQNVKYYDYTSVITAVNDWHYSIYF